MRRVTLQSLVGEDEVGPSEVIGGESDTGLPFSVF